MRPKALTLTALFIGNATLHALDLTMTDFPIPLWVIASLWAGWLTALGYEAGRWYKRRRLPPGLENNPGAVVVHNVGLLQTVEGDQHVHFDLGQISIPKSVPIVVAGSPKPQADTD